METNAAFFIIFSDRKVLLLRDSQDAGFRFLVHIIMIAEGP